ncbi:hypothetical protein CYMTET_26350 [Cymbomonas tetramitiformis]|uniref:Alpha-galactosidase n=1 Tax=Cymbomonas tetramitiformis TaxID=36881 RepID=A0AAE0FSP3_9CHLO|nr:hypothetical protein CYMTET_26350 [Cymbomonas tetramitiformis]
MSTSLSSHILSFAVTMMLFAGVEFAPQFAQGLENGVGRTPALGWNTWNQFGCNVSAALILEQARLLVSTGLAEKGYKYVNIDDCWQNHTRDSHGKLQADAKRFPDGISALSKELDAMGLLLGIYSDVGTKTCAGYPGSSGSYEIDAATFAEWGISYLKFDTCSLTAAERKDPRPAYGEMSTALNSTGRPILYSMCNWGQHKSYQWAGGMANSWRTTEDIWPQWQRVVELLEANKDLAQYARPGAFNDMDMIEVGVNGHVFNQKLLPRTKLTSREAESHFSLWALMSSPLILGLDLSQAPQWALDIVGNDEVIAMNQDAAGHQGNLVAEVKHGSILGGKCVSLGNCTHTQVWRKQLAGVQSVGVVLFNRGDDWTENSPKWQVETVQIPFSKLGFAADVSVHVRDVLEHKDLGVMTGSVALPVPPHGVRTLVLKAVGGAAYA